MPIVPLNFLALLLAAVVNMAIGMAWYSPLLFGTPWAKEKGMKTTNMKMKPAEMMKLILPAFIFAIVMAWVMRNFSYYAQEFYGGNLMFNATVTAFFAWLGFAVPLHLNNVSYDSFSWKTFAINVGYTFAAMLTTAWIVTALA